MPDTTEKTEKAFVNHYKCEKCGYKWADIWDSRCDDECPECGTVMTPYESIEVD